ncbi:hypothetical protein [Ichthyobacterium seriolicida]|uniref:Transposase n=1 Tax=Ichthyobacterium seriolicida TaxID=242600 RepID=A0A1J1DWI4_9FLAO|nr:hypothetical protein [Ichthyobacterium seriolicida]BAV94218.1 hypothetical protein JBKA6_0205 [Ichthyobacterium seriolicida]
MNISATQAIYDSVVELKKHNDALIDENIILKEKLSANEEKLDVLIEMLSKSNILTKGDKKILAKQQKLRKSNRAF